MHQKIDELMFVHIIIKKKSKMLSHRSYFVNMVHDCNWLAVAFFHKEILILLTAFYSTAHSAFLRHGNTFYCEKNKMAVCKSGEYYFDHIT